MKRSTLALAVSGLFAVPGLALAQSTVQVYGNVRAIFANIDPGTPNANSRNKVDNPGGSRIGFKGTESLGGGNSAWFQIESNIGPDTNAATNVLGSRNTAVGLQGGWGWMAMGNWDSPYKQVLIANQPWGATTPYGQVVMIGNGDVTTGAALTGLVAVQAGGTTAGGGSNAVAFERRSNNSLNYATPRFGGFQAKVQYVANETKTTTAAGDVNPYIYSLAGEYKGGPFYVGLGYEVHKDIVVRDREDKGIYIAGRYTAGPFEVGIGFERLEYEPTATQDLQRDAWHIDGQYKFGPHRIGLGYIKADDSSGSYVSPAAPGRAGALAPVGAIAPVQANGASTGADQWTIHYGYSLSKRTEITLAYARLSNEAAGVYSNRETAYGNSGLAGQDMNVFAVGLWHSF
jgi:predicted porin